MTRIPTATFALFAYNQEKYIREAIEGAFSQTYQLTEIILSDDYSRDSTFEIMKEMADAYRGPHTVKVRRSEVNLGTAQHLHAVAMLSRGEILIVAAGDDISLPNRTEAIVNAWVAFENEPSCVHSGAVFFDDAKVNRDLQHPPRSKSLLSKSERLQFLKKDKLPFLSPTCAYSRKLFEHFDPITGGSIIEDGVMALRSLVSGKVIALEEPLVRIRRQEQTSGTGHKIQDYDRWNRFILSRIISYATQINDLSNTNIEKYTEEKIKRRYARNAMRLSRFIIASSRSENWLSKLLFILKYLAFYPTSASILVSTAGAMSIVGAKESRLYRFGKSLFRRT